jgi:hypothetical protein
MKEKGYQTDNLVVSQDSESSIGRGLSTAAISMSSFPQVVCILGSAEAVSTTPVFTIIVSLIALLSALYVILSKKYPPKVEQWAYGTIGMILGFWLRRA